jgi:predicted lipoprotein with Yx(FWY)xxD motif
MRKVSTLLVLIGLVVVVAGCGDGGDGEPSAMRVTTDEAATEQEESATSRGDDSAKPNDGDTPSKEGTAVVLGDSEFGEMLYDAGDQAIYVFERDSAGKSNCYGECADAWPPVLTSGAPVAGEGVEEGLLGTTEREDGGTQVTYGGRPLYFYAHEAPGEVRCHNVDLNGGFWWVVGADGEPLA